jgi:hypothetical protein
MAASTTFSGQATVVRGSVPGVDLSALPCTPSSSTEFCLVDTGPLSATQATQGGANHESLACYPGGNGCTITSPVGDPTNGAVKARVLHAGVVAGGNQSRAEASVADLSVTVGTLTVGASFLTAQATAKCANGTAVVSGSAEVARVNSQPVLTIAGQTVVVAEAPNYDVVANLPAAVAALLPPNTQIVINRQSTGSNGNGGQQINVTGLYVNVAGAELAVADVHADITCAPQCSGPNAFVTSGGFVDPTGTDKQHFAAAGRNQTNWGHVLFRDSATGYTLHVKNPYAVVYKDFATLKADATTAKFDTSSLDEGKFQGGAILTWTDQGGGKALLVDEGEPGRSDYFQIIAPLATAAGLLAGGNIQMHGRC